MKKYFNIIIAVVVVLLVIFNIITIVNLLMDQQYIAKEIKDTFQSKYIYNQYSFLYQHIGINTIVVLILFFLRKK